MYFIDLDWADSVSSARFAALNYGVKIEVIEANGPGGGWPLIRFIGEKNNLIKFIVDSYDYDLKNLMNDYMDYFSDIKEYNEKI